MDKLILLGGGGHCESIIEVIEGLSKYEIVGILDPLYDSMKKQSILNYPIIGNDDLIEKLAKEGYQFVITVGQIKSSLIREKLFNRVTKAKGKLPILIAKTAYVSNHSLIGDGTVVMHYGMINSKTQIGKGNIINTHAIIEHGCIIGDFNHISTRVTLNGNVKIGNDTFIGSGTIINEENIVGNSVILGSGSIVRKDIKSNTIAFGTPLKSIKNE